MYWQDAGDETQAPSSVLYNIPFDEEYGVLWNNNCRENLTCAE
jgi:hypothetical protein